MKRVSAFLIILLSAFTLAGCAPAPRVDTVQFPWPVILVIRYGLETETVAETTQEALVDDLKTLCAGFDMEATIYLLGKDLDIKLHFATYKTFLEFNGMYRDKNDLEVVLYKYEKKMFLKQHTFTFNNPWQLIQERITEPDNRIFKIDRRVNLGFDLDKTQGVSYDFVLETNSRISRVEGAYKSVNMLTSYNYYFDYEDSTEELVVFERRANQPTWYVFALYSTLVFMAGFYLFYEFKNRRRGKAVPQIH